MLATDRPLCPRELSGNTKAQFSSVAGGLGFEPRLTESESAVLPLNYPPEFINAINMIAPQFAKNRCRILKIDATRAPV